ncbi:MAG: alpha-E domain-containing protein [Acidimicrobiales bacterium]
MILARHAEALFWAGRQLERAEATTRALDVVGRNSMHLREQRAHAEWVAMLGLFGAAAPPEARGRAADRDEVIRRLFLDGEHQGSVKATVFQLRENFRTVRDRVPVELWEEANRLHLELQRGDLARQLALTPFDLFTSVRRACQAMAGVAAEAMPRDETYTFFDSGRMLERCIITCRLARVGLADAGSGFEPSVLLRCSSSLQAYRREFGYADEPMRIATFLLCAGHTPRSVLSCLRRVDERLEALQEYGPGLGPARQLCGRARSNLEFGDVVGSLDNDALTFLDDIENALVGLSDVIAAYAFNPAHSPVLHAQFIRPGVDIS